MSEEKEQRVCITFCVKLWKNGAETFEMLITAVGDECLSRARTFEWFQMLKQDPNAVDDDPGDRQRAWKGLFSMNTSRKVT
jgi:hypothetical protein